MTENPPTVIILPGKRVRINWRPETRALIHAKCGGCCAYCGVPITLGEMTIDHIKPRAAGGTNAHENLNPACRRCNNFKSVFSVGEFRQELEAQVKRCREYSVNFRTAERFGMVKVVSDKVVFYFERCCE